jgi:hypothetical protein
MSARVLGGAGGVAGQTAVVPGGLDVTERTELSDVMRANVDLQSVRIRKIPLPWRQIT